MLHASDHKVLKVFTLTVQKARTNLTWISRANASLGLWSEGCLRTNQKFPRKNNPETTGSAIQHPLTVRDRSLHHVQVRHHPNPTCLCSTPRRACSYPPSRRATLCHYFPKHMTQACGFFSSLLSRRWDKTYLQAVKLHALSCRVRRRGLYSFLDRRPLFEYASSNARTRFTILFDHFELHASLPSTNGRDA